MRPPNITSKMETWFMIVVFISTFVISSGDNGLPCDVTKEPDVKYFDIRLPKMEVPGQLTTYVCHSQNIPLSMGVAYHAVAFEPIIDNKEVIHHMLMFGCMETTNNQPHNCSGEDNVCRSFLVQWSMGIQGQICSYPETGVRFGLDSFQSLSLQIHWNNARKSKGFFDSSGIRVYYTTHLRRYDAGNVQVGQNYLQIPSGVAHFPQNGSCSSECTRYLLNQPIYLTRAHIHLHYVGDGGILELIRSGQHVRTVVHDTHFDYNNPSYHNFGDPFKVLPGDELKLTCFFNTRDGEKYRNSTVFWGVGSDAEMCYAFITYFPYVPNFDQCIQLDKYDICSSNRHTDPIGGCVFEGFTNYFATTMANDILKGCLQSASTNGSTSYGLGHVNKEDKILCSEQCHNARKVMTDHPCMQNRLGDQMRRVYLPEVSSWKEVEVVLDNASKLCKD